MFMFHKKSKIMTKCIMLIPYLVCNILPAFIRINHYYETNTAICLIYLLSRNKQINGEETNSQLTFPTCYTVSIASFRLHGSHLVGSYSDL